ncbi:MAG TPA: hypothetical protein VK509_00395, partial [Polyangiales bacterium]|nr:hypothetical protein [Polyangiales bacterium]
MSDWLYDRLGVGLLREDARGGVSANARAKELLSGVNHPTMGMALAALLGSAATGELEPALARARTGLPSELVSPSGLRVLISRDLEGVNAVLVQAVSDVGAQVSHELANALGAIAG